MMKYFLIVDDDPDDRDLVTEAMEDIEKECSCYRAADGKKAMDLLENKETGELPHLILLDVNMPVMNGWQLLSWLKGMERYRHIPVVMYSTSKHEEDIRQASKLGAHCFFTKPASFTELKKCVGLLNEHLEKGRLESLADESPLFFPANRR